MATTGLELTTVTSRNEGEPAVIHVDMFDTTLRDGAQSLPNNHQFPIGRKAELADSLATLGVNIIEAGFPATTDDFSDVAETAQLIGNRSYSVRNWLDSEEGEVTQFTPIIAGLTPSSPVAIETTWQALHSAKRPRIHTFISTDELHMAKKFPSMTREQVLKLGLDGILHAQELSAEHPGAQVEFSAEAASTTDMRFLERVVRSAVNLGVDVCNVPDTVGERDPHWMYGFYRRVIRWAKEENPEVVISAHNHNDLGNATSNTYSLVKAAVAEYRRTGIATHLQIETTICGLGERAGNTDVFPLVANLHKFAEKERAPLSWQFNPQHAVVTAEYVMNMAGLDVPRQSPIVGRDTNRHRSGIHSDGVLKGGHRVYTPYDPQFWGHRESAIHETGRYQGRKGAAAAQLYEDNE